MATPELFTVTYWEVLGTQVIHAAAGGAVTALVAASTGTNVPWYDVLMAALIGGLTAFLLGLAGKLNPSTSPATLFIPTPKAVKRAVIAKKVAAKAVKQPNSPAKRTPPAKRAGGPGASV